MDEGLFFSPGQTYSGPELNTEQRPAKVRYQPPKEYLRKPDAIVIGSGIGALTLSSLLAQRRGMRVLVLEANKVPGGCTHCHEIDGYEFPSGVDSVGDMDPRIGRSINRKTIDVATGGKLSWARMPEIHETATFGEDDTYEWFSSVERNLEWLERRLPGEGNVRAYYELEAAIEASTDAWAITKILPGWVPQGLREAYYKAFGGPWRKYLPRTVEDVMRKDLGFSKRLVSIFSYMYGNHGRTPDLASFALHALTAHHYWKGAYYPVGGPAQVANTIVPIIEAAGGQVAVGSPVKRILLERGRVSGVELENGEKIESRLVISDSGARSTFTELLPEDVADAHGYRKLVEEVPDSVIHTYLFLGYDRPLDLPAHIIWQMPHYDGLDKYDIVGNDRVYKDQMRLEGLACYLLSPSARDPVHAQRYPGKSTVAVLSEGRADWVRKAKADPAFRADFSARLADGMMHAVERHFPMLKGLTPKVKLAGIPSGCNPRARDGCSLGLETSADRFIKHTHWTRPQTKVAGLYLVGQDAFAPGFCGAMVSGRMCYSAVTGDLFYMLVPKPKPPKVKELPAKPDQAQLAAPKPEEPKPSADKPEQPRPTAGA